MTTFPYQKTLADKKTICSKHICIVNFRLFFVARKLGVTSLVLLLKPSASHPLGSFVRTIAAVHCGGTLPCHTSDKWVMLLVVRRWNSANCFNFGSWATLYASVAGRNVSDGCCRVASHGW